MTSILPLYLSLPKNPVRVGVKILRSPLRAAARAAVNMTSSSSPPSSLFSLEAKGMNSDHHEDQATTSVLVQYVVLRRDLIDTWPLGSIVTQGCHASVSAIWMHKEDPDTLAYCCPESLDTMHKVTLEVKGEAQILSLSQKLKAAGILHMVWIEQPEGIPTCLATKPYRKSVVSSHFRKLKLCK